MSDLRPKTLDEILESIEADVTLIRQYVNHTGIQMDGMSHVAGVLECTRDRAKAVCLHAGINPDSTKTQQDRKRREKA